MTPTMSRAISLRHHRKCRLRSRASCKFGVRSRLEACAPRFRYGRFRDQLLSKVTRKRKTSNVPSYTRANHHFVHKGQSSLRAQGSICFDASGQQILGAQASSLLLVPPLLAGSTKARRRTFLHLSRDQLLYPAVANERRPMPLRTQGPIITSYTRANLFRRERAADPGSAGFQPAPRAATTRGFN